MLVRIPRFPLCAPKTTISILIYPNQKMLIIAYSVDGWLCRGEQKKNQQHGMRFSRSISAKGRTENENEKQDSKLRSTLNLLTIFTFIHIYFVRFFFLVSHFLRCPTRARGICGVDTQPWFLFESYGVVRLEHRTMVFCSKIIIANEVRTNYS